jgi:hypothetical protein
MLQVTDAGESCDGDPADMPAETALLREIAELGEWLAGQGFDLRDDHAQADAGSRDRLYCHYGYLIGLKHALATLTSRGATVH